MGSHCVGVMFFRWPSSRESLAPKPAEITDILSGKVPDDSYSLESLDGQCALVDCRDLSLAQKNRFSNRTRVIEIESSAPLDYFLPGGTVKPSLIEKNRLKFKIPACNAAAKIYLGRAVARKAVQYALQVML